MTKFVNIAIVLSIIYRGTFR